MCVCECLRKRGALINPVDLCVADFTARKKTEKPMHKQKMRWADRSG